MGTSMYAPDYLRGLGIPTCIEIAEMIEKLIQDKDSLRARLAASEARVAELEGLLRKGEAVRERSG